MWQELFSALYLTGSLGAGIATDFPNDGLWYQEAFPHQFDRMTMVRKSGLGLKLNSRWSLEAGYVNLGSYGVTADFVYDHDYDADRHMCLAECDKPHHLSGRDRLQGGELLLVHTIPLSEQWTVHGKFGGAWLWHSMDIDVTPYHSPTVPFPQRGTMAMIVGGAGACWKWLCTDVLIYQAIGHTENPLTHQVVAPMLSLNIPLQELYK